MSEESTALVNWEERLSQFAMEAVTAESAPIGSFITTRGGILQWQGNAVAGNKLDVVVIGAVYENALYEDDFDPSNPASPICYSFSHNDKGMTPHAESEKPQHATCDGCPQNEWGSADRGKGKACKNIRRLAMLPAVPLDAPTLQAAEVAYMKLPVTSTKNWANYVNTVAGIHKRPPFGVITTVSCRPDPKTQYQVIFENPRLITDGEVLSTLIARYEAQAQILPTAYPKNSPKEEAPKGKGTKKY